MRPRKSSPQRRVIALKSIYSVIAFDKGTIFPNGPQYMSETPVPRVPGRDGTPPGVPAGPGDYPRLGSPGWRLVPQGPDWEEAWLAARAEDEDPGDPDEYAGPTDAGAAAARSSLATGRSRVGRACTAPLPDCQAAKAIRDAGAATYPGCARRTTMPATSVHNRRCAGSIGTQTSLMALKIPQRHSHLGDLEVGRGAVAATIGRDHAADGGQPFGGDHVPGPVFPPGLTECCYRLKGQGLDLRRFGLDAESGLGEESIDQGGPVLDALEPVLHDGGQLAR